MYQVYVITASDKGAEGLRDDKSGELIEKMMLEANFRLIGRDILPDERDLLAERMRVLADRGDVDLILTTGGTGFSPRDWTPEATMDVCERMTPGISEALRAESMKITGRAMLSRASSGIRKQTLIVNLPGSPKAVREHLEILIPQLDHGLAILTGRAHDCAQPDKGEGH